MSEESDHTAEETALDGDDVARALREQIDAVKARMEDHRAVMRAAGLAPPPPAEPDGGES